MKVTYPLALVVAVAALLGSSGPLCASETDDRIESSFKDSLAYKTYLKNERVDISSKDGAVTLSGAVGSKDAYRQLAQNTAKALPGVKSVDNHIIVLLNLNAQKTDVFVKNDSRALPNVDAQETDVSVKDGIRRVPFQASMFQAKKEQTTEFAKDVEGVKEVKDEMSVAKASETPAETVGKSINDASITAQVKRSLSSHRLTRVLNTKVTTVNGVVLIGGKASNGAQKDLVTKLVTDVNGVKRVVNHMIIEEIMSKND